MPKLANITASILGGWKAFSSNLALSGYATLSVVYVYLVISYHSIIASSLGSAQGLAFLFFLFVCTIVSMAAGAIYSGKMKRRDHYAWNLIGILFGLVILFPLDATIKLLLLAVLGGLSSSLGIPDLLNYMLGRMTFENRGMASGIFLFIVYILLFVFTLIVSDVTYLAASLIVLKTLSLVLSYKSTYEPIKAEDLPSASSKVSTKLYFLLVWFIFLLVDAIATNVALQMVARSELLVLSLFTTLVGLGAMILGGHFMDALGRKRIMIFAYAYLGVEYAIITLSYGTFIGLSFLDGIAWGILTTMFTLVIWGDLAHPKNRPKYLAASLGIAVGMIFIKNILQVANIPLPPEQTFPLTSIFLFIAVIITLFLPETLPDKVVQARELQDYIDQAKKIKEKYD